MADIGRRKFMQLFGVGGVAAATLAVSVPVFGADGAQRIWTPDERIVGGHTVLVRPADWASWTRLGSNPGYESTPWPTTCAPIYGPEGLVAPGRVAQSLPGVKTLVERVFPVPLSEHHTTEEAHEAFYKGGRFLRETFKTEATRILERVPEPLRRDARIVTLAAQPLRADALYVYAGNGGDCSVTGGDAEAGTASAHGGDGSIIAGDGGRERRPGFVIRALCQQYVIVGDVEPNMWEVYSETGEFPIDVPSDLDMEHLLRMDAAMFATSITYSVEHEGSETIVRTSAGEWRFPGIQLQRKDGLITTVLEGDLKRVRS